MSKEINHWCVICGKGYHACDSCNDIKAFTPWRVLTDTQNHFMIFSTLKAYNNKVISKEEAKEELSKCDLSDKDIFKDSVKALINEIRKDDNAARKVQKTKPVTKTDNMILKENSVADDTADAQ